MKEILVDSVGGIVPFPRSGTAQLADLQFLGGLGLLVVERNVLIDVVEGEELDLRVVFFPVIPDVSVVPVLTE